MKSSLLGRPTFLALLVSTAACGGGAAATPAPTTPTSTTTSAAPTPAPAGAADSTLPKAADHPESDRVSWKKDATVKSCHKGLKGGDLVAGATQMATACVDPKMHQLGQPTTGTGLASSATMVQSIPLKAQANHCYRVFGLAEPTVTDFDIAVIDSAGKSAGEDLTDSNDAVVLENGSICFKQDDTASVNAAVAAGTGKWALEIWSD
jgi:hypothetical protein